MEDRIVRSIADKTFSMIPGETSDSSRDGGCNGCFFKYKTDCSKAVEGNIIEGVPYCSYYESVWRLMPAEVNKQKRRKLTTQ